MLATLERPSGKSVDPTRALAPDRPGPAAIPPKRLTLLLPPPTDTVPALVPFQARDQARRVPRVRAVQRATRPPSLRMTVRARRLLAGLALLCSVGVGVVAVDVLSAVVPFTPASYTAQSAPYGGSSEGAVGSAGLVPASGSTFVVAEGDTLWSVAQRLAPDADPRTVIAAIMTVNGLDSPSIQAGQVLRLP